MERYAHIVRLMKRRHGVRVRRWRSNMTGCAWQAHHPGGRVVNLIEAPMPKTPLSLSIFLHEVAHHVIGFGRYRTRCEEEFHAWQWALNAMAQLGVEPDTPTLRRYELSMRYAVQKARRRGIKILPAPLEHFAA